MSDLVGAGPVNEICGEARSEHRIIKIDSIWQVQVLKNNQWVPIAEFIKRGAAQALVKHIQGIQGLVARIE